MSILHLKACKSVYMVPSSFASEEAAYLLFISSVAANKNAYLVNLVRKFEILVDMVVVYVSATLTHNPVSPTSCIQKHCCGKSHDRWMTK